MGPHVGTNNGNILGMLPKVTHTPQKFMQTQSQRVCIIIMVKMINGKQSDIFALWCLTVTVYFMQQIIAEATIIDLLYYTTAQSNQMCTHVIINKWYCHSTTECGQH